MRARFILLVVVLLLIAAFAALNWPVFMTAAELSVGFTTFSAPLGLLMLGAMAVLVLGFVIYMAIWQGTILMDTRRHSRELQVQRNLADQAEASRFTELRAHLQGELDRVTARIAQSEDALRRELQESTQSLSAYIGEMDDRLDPGRTSLTPVTPVTPTLR
jgi:uncharacterized integral membrane protein